MLEAENMLQFFAVSDLTCPRRSDGGVRREACGRIEIRRKWGREGKGVRERERRFLHSINQSINQLYLNTVNGSASWFSDMPCDNYNL